MSGVVRGIFEELRTRWGVQHGRNSAGWITHHHVRRFRVIEIRDRLLSLPDIGLTLHNGQHHYVRCYGNMFLNRLEITPRNVSTDGEPSDSFKSKARFT